LGACPGGRQHNLCRSAVSQHFDLEFRWRVFK